MVRTANKRGLFDSWKISSVSDNKSCLLFQLWGLTDLQIVHAFFKILYCFSQTTISHYNIIRTIIFLTAWPAKPINMFLPAKIKQIGKNKCIKNNFCRVKLSQIPVVYLCPEHEQLSLKYLFLKTIHLKKRLLFYVISCRAVWNP